MILKSLCDNPKKYIFHRIKCILVVVRVIVYLTKDNVSQDLSSICDIDAYNF